MKKSYWIKERFNPQLKNSYFTSCGQLTVKEAATKEKSLYGSNHMHRFVTKEEYEARLVELGLLKEAGK